MTHWIKLRWKVWRARWTGVCPDFETLVALHGIEFADKLIHNIDNRVREMRASGITELSCPQCGDAPKKLYDPDSEEYKEKHRIEREKAISCP